MPDEKSIYPRVLFVANNPFSVLWNNGKTYTTLFKGWPKDRLAQLYFRPDMPDRTVCENFFLIGDGDILKGLLPTYSPGNHLTFGVQADARTQYEISPILQLGRRITGVGLSCVVKDLLWNTNNWNHAKLEQWIGEFAPEVVICVGGFYTFPLKIVQWISEHFEIPLVMYYTDDYLTKPKYGSKITNYQYGKVMDAFYDIREHIDAMLVIGDMMAAEYESRFDIPCVPVMNSVNIEDYENSTPVVRDPNGCITIAYFGGLHTERWHTLEAIGDCLQELKQEGIQAELHIFSLQELSSAMRAALHRPPTVQFKGGLDQQETLKQMMMTDILVHVESFEPEQRNKTRLSVSTKIPEYLATGNCVLGVGPEEIASMQYLKQTDGAAVTLTRLDKEEMKLILRRLILDADERRHMGEKAREWAKLHHSQPMIHQRFLQCIADAVTSSA